MRLAYFISKGVPIDEAICVAIAIGTIVAIPVSVDPVVTDTGELLDEWIDTADEA